MLVHYELVFRCIKTVIERSLNSTLPYSDLGSVKSEGRFAENWSVNSSEYL